MWGLLRRTAVALAVIVAGTPALSWAQELRLPPPVSGRTLGGPDPLQPADLLARTVLLKAHLEDIRVYMGRPKPPAPLIRVEGARTRELFAQSVIFYERIQQLAFEQLRLPQDRIRPREKPPEAADIMATLDKSLLRVLQLKRFLGIDRPVAEVARPASTTPTEVFNEVLEAAQLAHALLDEKINASLVYSLILATTQMARTLHQERSGRFLPPPTPFVPAKTPGDVYGVLLESFDAVRVLTGRLGIEGLTFELRARDREVVPDDVLELTGILVSEVLVLHQAALGKFPKVPFISFSRKFPSHSYQRAQDLKAILLSLAKVRLSPKKKR